MDVVQQLRDLGFDFNPMFDSKFREYKDSINKLWHIGSEIAPGKYLITIGDWRTGERWTIKSGFETGLGDKEASSKDRDLLREAIKRQSEIIKGQTEEKHQQAKIRANEIWSSGASEPEETPYSKKKQICLPPDIKIQKEEEILLIPVYQYVDSRRELWSLQRIYPDGKKMFMKDGRVQGGFYSFPVPPDRAFDSIVICEGFATGCTLWNLIGGRCEVYVAFNAQNLVSVAEQVRLKYPGANIFIAADDDRFTPKNPGLKYASEASTLVGGRVIQPEWNGVTKGTDFNDWMTLTSPIIVMAYLEREIFGSSEPTQTVATNQESIPDQTSIDRSENTQEISNQNETSLKNYVLTKSVIEIETNIPSFNPTPRPWINGIKPMPLEVDQKGKTILPTEMEVATYIYDYYQGMMLKQGSEDLFVYNGKMWKHLGQKEKDEIVNQIKTSVHQKLTDRQAMGIFITLCRMIPYPPEYIDLFQPRTDRANFLNGTLHLDKVKGKWKLKFKPHSPLDYVTNIIPIEFDITRSVRNERLEKMFEDILAKDDEKNEKLLAIQEMYGLCIMPHFPRLFLLHGPAGSGKTSTIKPAQKLVDRENFCAVEPHEFEGFDMESLIGKTVNIVTDIDIGHPIKDANIKKIQDKTPVRIKRKYKSDLYVPLPSLHIFGANRIPPTWEASSGAHHRRWTFIKLHSMDKSDNTDSMFADEVFYHSPQGVLNFALDGLERFITNNAEHTTFKSDRESIMDWQLENDPIALFLRDVKTEQIWGLKFNSDARCKGSTFWTYFLNWFYDSYRREPKFGIKKFYSNLRALGVQILVIDHAMFLDGFEAKFPPETPSNPPFSKAVPPPWND